MRKLLAVIGFMMAVEGTALYAGCTMKCVTRNPFTGKCIAKIKVCSPSTEGVTRSVKKFAQDLQREYHNIYGYVPESVRNILNNYPCTIIGLAAGGLDAGLIGAAIDELLIKTQERLRRSKDLSEGAPDWKAWFYNKGVEIVTGTELQIIGEGQANKQHFKADLDRQHGVYNTCIGNAGDKPAAWDCVDSFEAAALGIKSKARR